MMKQLFTEIAKDYQTQVSLFGSVFGGLASILGSCIGVLASVGTMKYQLKREKNKKIDSDKNTYRKMLKLLSSELTHNIDIVKNIVISKDDISIIKTYASSLELDIWEKSRFDIIEYMDDKLFEDLLEGYRSLIEIKLHVLELNIQSEINYELREFYLLVTLEKIKIEIQRLDANQ